MRLLIVAMSDSIHTARWLSQIDDQGWDIHLFPSIDYGEIHRDLKNITVYHSIYGRLDRNKYKNIRFKGLYLRGSAFWRKLLRHFKPDHRVHRLARVIDGIKPDIVHSLEISTSGYLTLAARKLTDRPFPPWIVTCWGSDLYLFGRLDEHEPKIREVLGSCDYYSCECERDVKLARKYGFRGEVMPVFPNTGGFDIDSVKRFRSDGPSSERRVIMLKGYQNWAGRALVGLRALARCADLLDGYEIAVFSVNEHVAVALEIFSKETGISVKILPRGTPHEEVLRHHGRARISIGLSISDAVSTSLLEAMTMGSLPVQSWTACADEWIKDGVSGLLVPPEDTDVVEKALRKALTDDELVDKAAEINYGTAEKRLDASILKPKAVGFYRTVFEEDNP